MDKTREDFERWVDSKELTTEKFVGTEIYFYPSTELQWQAYKQGIADARNHRNAAAAENFEQFWKTICCNEDGTPNFDQIKLELLDFHSMMQQVSQVYDHITGGKVCKQMTDASIVIALADDHYAKCHAENDEEPEIKATCIICGLPLTKNPHPQASTPAMLNTIGATTGCLPCAEKRAYGRSRVMSALRIWLQRKNDAMVCILDVLDKLDELDEEQRKAFHDHSIDKRSNT